MDNEAIYFQDDDIFSKISDILRKNGIEENSVDALFKEKSYTDVILGLTKDLIKGKISEKDFISELQKNLGATPQVAENVIREVKEKILPSVEKIKIESQPIEEKLITTKPVRLINESQKTAENPTLPTETILEEKSVEKKIRAIKSIKKPIETKEIKNPYKKSDVYREPIE